MKYQKMTYIFIGLAILICVLYDVFVLVKGGTESSISHALIVWAYKYPILPFSAGFLCGHLFWRMKETKEVTEVTK